MTRKKTVKEVSVLDINKNIETTLDEITNVEEYIYQIVGNNGFYTPANPVQTSGGNAVFINNEENEYGFISVASETISEKEFLEIVDSDGKRCGKSAGLYQQSLFSRYLQAKEEQDQGYIQDIFEKAIEFRDNLERIKKLRENKAFMKEWRQNIGRVTPESELKHSGSMRKINIIESLSM